MFSSFVFVVGLFVLSVPFIRWKSLCACALCIATYIYIYIYRIWPSTAIMVKFKAIHSTFSSSLLDAFNIFDWMTMNENESTHTHRNSKKVASNSATKQKKFQFDAFMYLNIEKKKVLEKQTLRECNELQAFCFTLRFVFAVNDYFNPFYLEWNVKDRTGIINLFQLGSWLNRMNNSTKEYYFFFIMWTGNAIWEILEIDQTHV